MDEQTQPNPDNYSDTTEMEPEVIDHVSKMLSVGVKPRAIPAHMSWWLYREMAPPC